MAIFRLYCTKKIPKYASISGFFMICLNKKYLNSKLLCILKALILDEVQGKKANKPRGLFAFLTQKFAKSELFRTKLPYLVVAFAISFLVFVLNLIKFMCTQCCYSYANKRIYRIDKIWKIAKIVYADLCVKKYCYNSVYKIDIRVFFVCKK